MSAVCKRLGRQSRREDCLKGGGGKRSLYIYNGVLALHTGHELLLLNVHDEVLALVISWEAGDGNVNIADGLVPFVWKGSLFLLLLGEGSCRLGCSGLCETRRVNRDAQIESSVYGPELWCKFRVVVVWERSETTCPCLSS